MITKTEESDRKNKKRPIIIAALLTLGVLVGGGLTFAYWTVSGSGSGSSTADAGDDNLELTASFDPGIYPGASRTVSFTVTNNNPGPIRMGSISLDSVTVPPGCDSADFTMAPVAIDDEVPAGGPTALSQTGTLVFANTSVNQNACKGGTITLNIVSN